MVPLPTCDGPKLKPFDFQGPQKIEFLDYLGEGLHSHVMKVKILGQVYALKLFRFGYDENWIHLAGDVNTNDLEVMSAFYNYQEPFSCECRAFGRLQEAGHEELAIRCFGYLLLDEQHERAMMDRFSHLNLDFNGDNEWPGDEDMRSRFLGRDGRPPPIRGIVKEFGPGDDDLRARDMRKLLRDVIRLQQLGIIQLDVAHRQIISGKLCDFSTTITVPHFLTNPELNPCLTPEWISAMERETFDISCNDYWEFDDMVHSWNKEHEKNKISVHAFPGGTYPKIYNLRSMPSRGRVYSLIDPRLYDWKTPVASLEDSSTGPMDGPKSGPKTEGKPGGAMLKTRRRLDAKPPRWYYHHPLVAAGYRRGKQFYASIEWVYKDGLIFPQKRK